MLKKLFAVRSYGSSPDFGLLVLRVGTFVSMFIKHGIEKLTPSFYVEMANSFPDPFHLGHIPTLLIAAASDALCSALLVFGLFSRAASLYVFVILTVAWSFTHHFVFLGKGIEPKHGELIVVYFTVALALTFLGPGKFSLDAKLFGRSGR